MNNYLFFAALVFTATRGLSLLAVSEGYSSCSAQASCCGGLFCCSGFFCCIAWALWHTGISGCGAWASTFVARGLQSAGLIVWHLGWVVKQHVGSSWTRDRTSVPCPARWILSHWTTREALLSFFKSMLQCIFCFHFHACLRTVQPSIVMNIFFPPSIFSNHLGTSWHLLGSKVYPSQERLC